MPNLIKKQAQGRKNFILKTLVNLFFSHDMLILFRWSSFTSLLHLFGFLVWGTLLHLLTLFFLCHNLKKYYQKSIIINP